MVKVFNMRTMETVEIDAQTPLVALLIVVRERRVSGSMVRGQLSTAIGDWVVMNDNRGE
jgi:hypothetical protein